MRTGWTVAALTLVAGFTASLVVAQQSAGNALDFLGTRTNRLTPVVKAVHTTLPSVVSLSTERLINYTRSPWGDDDPFFHSSSETEALGSGFIIDESGLILTNAHVIHNASRIKITTPAGKVFEARRLAEDPDVDLALLRVVTPAADITPLPPIRFGRVGDLMLGETVIAIGNPYGLGASVATGVISGVERKATHNRRVIFDGIIQTSVAINPGHSGSPLVNLDGETIGMTMASFKGADGIAFAVPLSHIREALARWLVPENTGEVWLGLSLDALPYDTSILRVTEVAPGSPAEEAGFMRGDQIVGIDDQPLSGTIDMGRYLFKLKPGRGVNFQLADGRVLTLVTEPLPLADGRSLAQMKLGIGLQNLTPMLAKSLRYPLSDGLIVTRPPANTTEVRRGDILRRLNHIPISSFRDVVRALRSVPVGSEVQAEFGQVRFDEKTNEPQLIPHSTTLKAGK